LSIAKAIVKRTRPEISFQSVEGHGRRFVVDLPAADA